MRTLCSSLAVVFVALALVGCGITRYTFEPDSISIKIAPGASADDTGPGTEDVETDGGYAHAAPGGVVVRIMIGNGSDTSNAPKTTPSSSVGVGVGGGTGSGGTVDGAPGD